MSQLPCPSEFEEGKIFVAYLRMRGLKFTHIPNETGSSMEARRRAIRMKQSGTSRGFVDYIIALPGVGLVVIELKRKHGGRLSPEQREWLNVLNSCPGTEARECRGAEAAIAFVEELAPRSSVTVGAGSF